MLSVLLEVDGTGGTFFVSEHRVTSLDVHNLSDMKRYPAQEAPNLRRCLLFLVLRFLSLLLKFTSTRTTT